MSKASKLADIGLVAPDEASFSAVGTLGYVAPEGASSAQADLYSLGKVLYEASTGKDRTLFPEPLTAVVGGAEAELWAELNEVIRKACNLDPAGRYVSAGVMREELALLRAGRSLRRLRAAERRVRRLRRGLAAILVVALLGGGAYSYEQRQARHFKELAEEHRRSLVRVNVSNGLRQMADGEGMGALPWLVEALRLDANDQARESPHRRRIAAILRQCPRLIALGVHQGPIHCAELSPDGTRVLTGSSDGTAALERQRRSAVNATDAARLRCQDREPQSGWDESRDRE